MTRFKERRFNYYFFLVKTFSFWLAVFCMLGGSAFAQTEIEIVPTAAAADTKIYGEYPIAYRDLITRWLETKLLDAPSALIDWGDPPKAGEYRTAKGPRYVGYIVDFKVNARNQFGAYTGKQKYRVVIRNGDVMWGGRPRS